MMIRAVPMATSRYQAHELVVASGLVPVRITLGAPRWRLPYQLGGTIRMLAPTRDLFAQRGDPGFEERYIAQLEKTGVGTLAHAIDEVSEEHGGRGLVLLCFEDVSVHGESSCHRRMFARWWQSKTGQHVGELAGCPQGPVS